MWTIEFWRNLAERALKSAANGALLVVTGSQVADLFALDAKVIVGGAGFGALYSVLMSLGSNVAPIGNPGTASLAKSVIAVDPGPNVHPSATDA